MRKTHNTNTFLQFDNEIVLRFWNCPFVNPLTSIGGVSSTVVSLDQKQK